MPGPLNRIRNFSSQTGKSEPCLWAVLVPVTFLLFAVQVSSEEVLLFQDSEDMILDGAPEDVDSFAPAVAMNGLDQAGLVWSDNQAGEIDTLLGIFDRNLDAVSDIVIVNELFQETTTRSPRVSPGSDEAFTMVWSDNRSVEQLFDVFLTRIDNEEDKLFTDVRVNEAYNNTNVETPDVASIGDGLICICWVDNRQSLRDVYARRFQENGSAVDARDYIVNPAYDETNATHPRVSGDAEGTAVIVWSDDRLLITGPPTDTRSDIFARVLPVSGITDNEGEWPGLEREIRVSNDDRGTDDALDPDIAGNGHGLYVVAWRNQTSDGRDRHIYAAVITSSGDRLTGEFQVDLAPSPASTADPAVTFLGYDLFLISWRDEREDGLVVGQIYDAAVDWFVSDEFVITDLVGPVAQPTAGSFSDRAFVTAWVNGQTGAQDVLGNVFFWDLLGDLNVDVAVSVPDLYNFASYWQPETVGSTAADLDADGFVDAKDVRTLGREFRTNLADRAPLSFSAKSAAKSAGIHRKISVMNTRRTAAVTTKTRRGDRTKPRRDASFTAPASIDGKTPAGSVGNALLPEPVRARSPRPGTDKPMNDTPFGVVQNDGGQRGNQTSERGMLFLGGIWR
jgi:hypothetical protein